MDEDDDLFEDQSFKKDNTKVNKTNSNILLNKKEDSLKKIDNTTGGLLKLSSNMDVTFADKKKIPTKKFADKHILFRKFLSQNK